MTTNSVSLRPSASELIAALTPNDNSFLSSRILDLDPRKLSTYRTHSTLWLVAAGATFVAFTALAGSTFFYAGMFLPTYVPFVGIGALLLAMPVANFVKNFLECSEASRKEGVKFSKFQTNFENINAKAIHHLQNDLAARGIVWHQIPGVQRANPESLSKLNPLLAWAQYLDDKMQEEMALKQDLTQEARDLANTHFSKNRQKIYDLRNAALFAEDRALQTKVNAAFTNAVLRKPNYSGSLADIVTVTDVGYHERILGEALSDPTVTSEFIKFKSRHFTPISYADFKRMTIAELGQRLVAAMT